MFNRHDKEKSFRKELPTLSPGDKVYFYANKGAGKRDKLSIMRNGLATVVEKTGLDYYLTKDGDSHIINGIMPNILNW